MTTTFQDRLSAYVDEQSQVRPKPWLTVAQRSGYYASMFTVMRWHDTNGYTWTRDKIGECLKRRAEQAIDNPLHV